MAEEKLDVGARTPASSATSGQQLLGAQPSAEVARAPPGRVGRTKAEVKLLQTPSPASYQPPPASLRMLGTSDTTLRAWPLMRQILLSALPEVPAVARYTQTIQKDAPLCSQQHYSQQPRPANTLNVCRQMSGYRRCGYIHSTDTTQL